MQPLEAILESEKPPLAMQLSYYHWTGGCKAEAGTQISLGIKGNGALLNWWADPRLARQTRT